MGDEGIDYINARASFESSEMVSFDYDSKSYNLNATSFLIATGGRPRSHPTICPSLSVTSDDLFSLDKDPGATLVIGGGYIAIECAGFLRGLGKPVHMLNRSSFLRTMDSDMAMRIVSELEE